MSVEFQDFSVKVTEAMSEALIAGLSEAAGEIQARAKRNSRPGHSYGNKQASELWEYRVNDAEMEAQIGSPYEAGFWEEFGTGEHSLYPEKARKGWWVYIEGKESGTGGKEHATREEAEEAANFLRRVKKLNAQVTDGMEPNEPLRRAFASAKPYVEAIFEAKLKGLG